MSWTVKTLESSDGRERVLISRRPDGNYTYQRQWLRGMAWGPPGLDCGVYDSASLQLKARRHASTTRRIHLRAQCGYPIAPDSSNLNNRAETDPNISSSGAPARRNDL